MTPMDLSVAIVNYNAEEELAACLGSLFANGGQSAIEVVVADNASSDRSREMLARRFPQVRLIRSDENLGFARASNLCWQAARSSLVLFLNSDTLVPKGAIDRLVAIARARPDVGVVGPKLLHPDGSIEMSFGKMLGFTTEFLQKCRNAGYARGRGPLRRAVLNAYSREREVDWVSGACLLTRRDLLETVCGFDENFFMYSEDVDLCARIRSAGAKVLFTPEVEVVHLLGRSAAKNHERVLIETHRSRLYFYRKHYGGAHVLLLKLYLTLKVGLAYVFRPVDRPSYRRILRVVGSF